MHLAVTLYKHVLFTYKIFFFYFKNILSFHYTGRVPEVRNCMEKI